MIEHDIFRIKTKKIDFTLSNNDLWPIPNNLIRWLTNTSNKYHHSHIFIPHPPHLLNYFGHLDYGELQNDPPNKNTKKLLRDMCRLIDNHIFPWDEYNLQVDALEQNIVYPSHFGLMATIYENALRQSSPRKTRWGCKSTFMIHYIEIKLSFFLFGYLVKFLRHQNQLTYFVQ